MYLVQALDVARGRVTPGVDVIWAVNEIRFVDDREIGWYQINSSVFTVLAGPDLFTADVAYGILVADSGGLIPAGRANSQPAALAVGTVDFNATGEAGACDVVIGGVTYAEADTAVPATGVWTNGASAADSATSLIAAINGDLRATVPVTAYADTSGDGVILIADTAGVAGNLAITTESASNCTVTANMVGGLDAAAHDTLTFAHTITTQELLAGDITLPLPFTPTGFHVQAYSATGAPIFFTDLVTIEATPDRLLITTDGATNLANTNVIHVTVFN